MSRKIKVHNTSLVKEIELFLVNCSLGEEEKDKVVNFVNRAWDNALFHASDNGVIDDEELTDNY